MANKTFEKGGQRRSTSSVREQVALVAAGWVEVKPAPRPKKRTPKKKTDMVPPEAAAQGASIAPAFERKPVDDKSEKTSK